ncbi:MAG TPA: VTT domain-containing protein, partial [Anaerolineales bacterium]|nr:VTT domain-containing protein [Anaerolineales bacterium]
WGPVVLFILLVLQVFLAFIPGQALMVACGYVYGFWGGLFISWFSLFAGGQAAFFLARRFGRPFANRWISPEILSKWDKAADGQGVGFYALSLVLPVFPNDAMCYVAGLGKISSSRFSIANSLGRGLACLFTSAAGAFGSQLGWQSWGIVAIVILIACLGWFVIRNFKSRILVA